MKFLSFIISFSIVMAIQSAFAQVEESRCQKAFGIKDSDRQFVEIVISHLSFSKESLEKQTLVKELTNRMAKDTGRREVLLHLMKEGRIALQNPTPLWQALLNHQADPIQIIKTHPRLAQKGALLGNSPFFIAVLLGKTEVVSAFIKNIPNTKWVSLKNKLGETPLHYAVDPDMATLLLFHKSKVNAQDKKGNTPLHNVKNPNTAEVLLFYGADPSIKNRSGVSALKHHEEGDGEKSVAEFLQEWNKSLKDNNSQTDIKDTPPPQETAKSVEQQERERVEREKQERIKLAKEREERERVARKREEEKQKNRLKHKKEQEESRLRERQIKKENLESQLEKITELKERLKDQIKATEPEQAKEMIRKALSMDDEILEVVKNKVDNALVDLTNERGWNDSRANKVKQETPRDMIEVVWNYFNHNDGSEFDKRIGIIKKRMTGLLKKLQAQEWKLQKQLDKLKKEEKLEQSENPR